MANQAIEMLINGTKELLENKEQFMDSLTLILKPITETNQKCEHLEWNDLGMFLALDGGNHGDEHATVYLPADGISKIAEEFDASVNNLYDIAMENAGRINEPVISDMTAILSRMVNSSSGNVFTAMNPSEYPESQMLVMSNRSGIHGATAVLFADAKLTEICKAWNTDSIYLLPSSIHEWIIPNPNFGELDPDFLRDMVQSINQTEVEERDRLSDSLYQFTAGKGISIVEP